MNITPKNIFDMRSFTFSFFGKKLGLSADVIEYLLDFTIYSIKLQKERYNNVLTEMMGSHFNPVRFCAEDCHLRPKTFFSDGFINSMPILRRSTHATCDNCGAGLSTYSCSVCEDCANPNDYPEDFNYYHRDCWREPLIYPPFFTFNQ